MIGTTLGYYQVEEKIGQGGMGVVYLSPDGRYLVYVALVDGATDNCYRPVYGYKVAPVQNLICTSAQPWR